MHPLSIIHNKKVFFLAIVGVALIISLVAISWFRSHKVTTEKNNSDNPYLLLKGLNPEAEIVTKDTFEKSFSNGGEIFDWLMKNNYFQEKERLAGHPRFISPNQKADLKNKYPLESEQIIAIFQQANSSRHAFIVKSSEISNKLVDHAWKAFNKGNIKEAVKSCNIAINICPINTKPYSFLTKLYLMNGQGQKMFETLSLAGRSYPDFNSIVALIDDENLAKIPLDEPPENIFLANFPENKKMAISFLFDDGKKNIYDNALPIFERHGFRATLPIVAGMVAEKDDDSDSGSWRQWKDAANRGFEIANHSMYHDNSKNLHGSDFDVSIDQAKELIEKNIGRKITAYVFPGNNYTDEAVNRALREHTVVHSWEFLRSNYNKTVGITYGGPNFSIETANRLVDIGIKQRLWFIMTCHGVTTKKGGLISFKSITPSFLESHLSYIHSKSSDVWVDTFTNVFEYLNMRKQTTIEIKNISTNSADFILQSANLENKLNFPLTVVIKTRMDAYNAVAQTANGHTFKSWPCDVDQLCIDIDSLDDNIHVEWSSRK